jgi:hypothetical protein
VKKYVVGVLNFLLVVCAAGVGDLWFTHIRETQPQIVVNGLPSECDFTEIASTAIDLAFFCKDAIKKRGGFLNDSELTEAIAARAKEMRYQWPGPYMTETHGKIFDCRGHPFEIVVTPVAASVTSESLDAYYVALLNNSR